MFVGSFNSSFLSWLIDLLCETPEMLFFCMSVKCCACFDWAPGAWCCARLLALGASLPAPGYARLSDKGLPASLHLAHASACPDTQTAPGVETINFGQKKTVDALHELVPNGPDVVIEAVGFHYTNSMIHKVRNFKTGSSSFGHLVCFLNSFLWPTPGCK